jgi:SPP1 family phage portal protein
MNQTKYSFGRRMLLTSEETITSENVVEVLKKVLPDFNKNESDSEYLYSYFNGNQPILNRVKKFRPEINNKVVENHAHEIVNFKTGYDFGEPIQYVRRATKNGTGSEIDINYSSDKEDMEVTSKITLLNEFMHCEDKSSKDKNLAEWFYITGSAFRMVLPNPDYPEDSGSPFTIDTLDSRYTAVVYNSGFRKKPVMSIQKVVLDNDKVLYCIYTENLYFEILDNAITKCDSNLLGSIPVIEYPANSSRTGSFELVIGLLDEINNVESNRIDGIEQFVQSFMKFINVNIDSDKYEELKEQGAILVKSDPNCPADVDVISSELNQSQVQTALDHLYQMVLIICGMPDRNGANRTTGDTGQAVILRDGWTSAEAEAKNVEGVFKPAEKKFLKIALSIMRDLSHIDIKLSDIDIKFTRNKTDNIVTKTQAMQSMLESGIHPQISITNSGLFSDPEQVYLDSLPYLQAKWKTKGETESESEKLQNNGQSQTISASNVENKNEVLKDSN